MDWNMVFMANFTQSGGLRLGMAGGMTESGDVEDGCRNFGLSSGLDDCGWRQLVELNLPYSFFPLALRFIMPTT